jgi:dTDP-4-amino-4,6-dideoxygalactose transaminase
MDECQAAFLSIKLKHLGEWITQRQTIAAWYQTHLQSIQEVILPQVAEGATHVYHLYVIRCNERDALQQHLQTQGIGTLIHYPIPPHLQQAYQSLNFSQGSFPIAEEIANTCLSLPLWPGLTEGDVKTIASEIKKFFAR